MRHLKDTQIKVMIEKSEGRKEELPMKNLTGKILLALSFCMLSFLVPHSFSQAKVLNFDIYDGDMPGEHRLGSPLRWVCLRRQIGRAALRRKHFEMKGVYHVELCIMLHKETC